MEAVVGTKVESADLLACHMEVVAKISLKNQLYSSPLSHMT